MSTSWLQRKLTSRNGLARKAARALLAVPKQARVWKANREMLAATPAVLANSFPKSGTHLLAQVIDGLPDRVNYGAFLGSEISSFQFRERSPQSTCRFIRRFVPGEVVRGHLFFDPGYAKELKDRHAVHYFIYRDPRDVVVSEAHYLREMNRWHRLHRYFRRTASLEEAISLAINGLDPPVAGIDYPNIAERFARYEGWLDCNDCLSVRFEDLRSDRQGEIIRAMAEFYAARCAHAGDTAAWAEAMQANIAPHKSHTFRSGEKSAWQREFSAAHRRRFDEVAGDLLIRLGYESNHDWVASHVAESV